MDIFSKKYSNINFMKIPSVGVELFHAQTDRQTDRRTNRQT